MSTHRADIDMSSKYAAMENTFIGISKGDKDNPQYYEMNAAEKDCLDSFMEARNNALLWGKTNLDKNGKPTAYDNEVGRPIISGDGLVAQVERFATKFMFSKLNVSWFKKALNAMVQKSDNPTGNKYIMVVNTLLWNDVQNVLDAWLKDYATDGTFLYSKGENGYMNVGATYQSYTWAGNTISFKIDRSFDIEYPDRKFGVMIDLTPDGQKGHAALNLLTFKGGQIIHNWVKGVGGINGLSSGEVSSPVAGSKIIYHGYAGIAVYNPYRSVIMMSDKVKNMMF